MISGTAYLFRDLIESGTVLRFHGIRDDKLAFKDKNGVVYLKSF